MRNNNDDNRKGYKAMDSQSQVVDAFEMEICIPT
jgi:hypothetical protein